MVSFLPNRFNQRYRERIPLLLRGLIGRRHRRINDTAVIVCLGIPSGTALKVGHASDNSRIGVACPPQSPKEGHCKRPSWMEQPTYFGRLMTGLRHNHRPHPTSPPRPPRPRLRHRPSCCCHNILTVAAVKDNTLRVGGSRVGSPLIRLHGLLPRLRPVRGSLLARTSPRNVSFLAPLDVLT
jgi:hypothetical protein